MLQLSFIIMEVKLINLNIHEFLFEEAAMFILVKEGLLD